MADKADKRRKRRQELRQAGWICVGSDVWVNPVWPERTYSLAEAYKKLTGAT